MSKIPFTQSPHQPLVIMHGHSQAGRVYRHDGIRTEEETRAILNLWLASQEMVDALGAIIEAHDSYLEDVPLAVKNPDPLTDAIEASRPILAKARGEAQ